MVATFVLGLATLGCGSSSAGPSAGEGAGAGTGTHIKLMGRPWEAADLDNQIARILLTEQLGMTVEIVPVSSADIVTPLHDGDVHVDLEAWPDGQVRADLASGSAENG